MDISKETIVDIIKYCNRDLVPDSSFDHKSQYHSDWFREYFSFLKKGEEAEHLGEAFYQARFIYKIMSALKLPLRKQSGIVKFQIVQYASICEAVMDITIYEFFKSEAEQEFSCNEYRCYNNAISKKRKLSMKILRRRFHYLFVKCIRKRGI